MVDLIAIQEEQITWSERNFGKQHARYPLLGLIEECLEFDEAWKLKEEALQGGGAQLAKYLADVDDAIGDIGIYMLDYCGKMGLQLNDLWKSREFLDERMHTRWYDLVPLARRLAHHQLKGEQGIRGTPDDHNRAIERTCRAILAHLELVCSHNQKDFLTIISAVWAQVRKRDWTKNPTNAHEVAAS